MSEPTLPSSLRKCFGDAVADARRRRNEYITLEHLLLAMLAEDRAREILQACGAKIKQLHQDLGEFLENNLEKVPPGAVVEPEQTVGLGRTLARAFWHAESAGQTAIESGDLLAAMLEEKDSQARYLLERQGVTRLDVLSYVSHE
ncbi:MAG: ATP-dependent Clp protease ATP-binding subunit ClpA, partial [Chloroflexi bacterium]|nr:ATP-dependent Clp protease ATP-binding subunit ClpA [Chloroflexota bacterium]